MVKSEWEGYIRYDFSVNGRESHIILPEKFNKNSQWVWRAEFFGAFDTVDRALLKDGWAIAYHKISDMYGCPESIEMMKEFYNYITAEFELSKNPVIFGFSRGGLYTVNYAAAYPEDVKCIYLDAPVLNIRSWPIGKQINITQWHECLKCYNLTDETVVSFKGNPLDKIDILVKNKISVVLVAGDADTIVPYAENGAIFNEKYIELGGNIKTIVKPGVDHHPHSLEDPSEIVEFIKKNNN